MNDKRAKSAVYEGLPRQKERKPERRHFKTYNPYTEDFKNRDGKRGADENNKEILQRLCLREGINPPGIAFWK